MDLTSARELLTLVGLSSVTALLIAIGVSIIVNLVVYGIQRRVDLSRDKKIAEIQAAFDSTLKQLQTNLDVKSHVTRAQFDVEFTIYQEIWKKLAELKLETLTFVVTLEKVLVLGQGNMAAVESRLHSFQGSSDKCSTYVEENVPFYAKAVNVALYSLRDRYEKGVDIFGKGSDNPSQFLENSSDIAKEIVEHIHLVGETIRARLASIDIIK